MSRICCSVNRPKSLRRGSGMFCLSLRGFFLSRRWTTSASTARFIFALDATASDAAAVRVFVLIARCLIVVSVRFRSSGGLVDYRRHLLLARLDGFHVDADSRAEAITVVEM